jgi:hypothetical protein
VDPPVSTANLFRVLRQGLEGVLGSAATATILRRAAKRAKASAPQLDGIDGFEVVRQGFDYKYELPPSWYTPDSDVALGAFNYLISEHVRPIVVELTGVVGVGLFERISEELARQRGAAGEPPSR